MNFLSRFFTRKPKLTWEQAVQDLTDFENFDDTRFSKAYYAIDELSNESRITELYELLSHHEYIVREAAAYPLARIEGAKSLPYLLDALIRGEEDGHDNDSLAGVVSDLLERNKKESADILMGIYKTENSKLRVYAAWGFGFIVPEISSDFLTGNFINEENNEVRSALAGALGSFENDENVIHTLMNNIQDKNEDVRISIIYTLVHNGDKNVVEKVKALLKTETAHVKKHTQHLIK